MARSKPAATPAQKPAKKEPVVSCKPRTAIGAAIQKRYLTRREAATYLGCSIKFVISLVKDGKLAEHDLSRFVKRYRIEDVEAYAAAHRQEAFAKEAA